MIIKANKLKGTFTHVCSERFADSVESGKFVMRNNFNKPAGLWISWNKGWEEWCASEMPQWLENKVIFDVKLNPDITLWYIDTLKDFEDIWREFKPDYEKGGFGSISSIYEADNFWDWLKKEKKVDGIALSDKGQWETRMRTWLYGWDCACVVVFNPSDHITLLRPNSHKPIQSPTLKQKLKEYLLSLIQK